MSFLILLIVPSMIVVQLSVQGVLLVLEHWVDAPEIQRSADLYEDLIKCSIFTGGSYAWTHKNWRIHEEFARTISATIKLFATTEFSFQLSLLPLVLQLLEDLNKNAREAIMGCLEELYRQGGTQFHDEIQRHLLRPTQLKEINIIFERIQSNAHLSDGISDQVAVSELKSSSSLALRGAGLAMGGSKCSSPKAKPVFPKASSAIGDHGIIEKPIEEIEKISRMLTPEQEWSVR